MRAVLELVTPRHDPPESSGRLPSEYLQALAAEDLDINGRSSSDDLPVLDDSEIEHLPPVAWLADQLIPKAAITALYGAPGSGKSFLAIDFALSLAIGAPWLGRPVETCSTLYIAAEGRAGLGARVRAWKAAGGFSGQTLGVQFVTKPVNLLQPADVGRVLRAARTLEERWNRAVGLIVVDTLAQCMIGGDENEAQDMSRVMAAAQLLREETGATILFQHHTKKDSDEERGSTALRGAVDTLMLVEETDEGRQLVCRKQKDAEGFSSMAFRLVAGHGSCIVQGASSGEGSSEQAGPDALTPKRVQALRALRDSFTDRGATATEWLKASGLSDRTFYRVRTWATRNGYATESARGRITLSPSGRYATTAKPLPPLLPKPSAGGEESYDSPQQRVSGSGANGSRNGSKNGSNGNRNVHDSDEEYADLLAELDERSGMREEE